MKGNPPFKKNNRSFESVRFSTKNLAYIPLLKININEPKL